MKSILPGLFFTLSFLIISCTPREKEGNNEARPDRDPGGTASAKVSVTYRIDTKAVKIFENAMDYLSTLQKFSVDVQGTLEDIHVNGHRVDFEIASNLLVSRLQLNSRPLQIRKQQMRRLPSRRKQKRRVLHREITYPMAPL